MEAIGNGKFSVYRQDDGGYHIAYRFDLEDETRHIDIPYALVRLADKASGGALKLPFPAQVPE